MNYPIRNHTILHKKQIANGADKSGTKTKNSLFRRDDKFCTNLDRPQLGSLFLLSDEFQDG